MLLSEKTVTLYAELNEIAEAIFSSYFNFLKFIYSVLLAKKH